MAQTVFGSEAYPGPGVRTDPDELTLLPASGASDSEVVVRPAAPETPPPPPRAALPATERPLFLLSAMLTIVSVLALTFGLTLSVIGTVRHARDQQTAFATLRGQLANATAAVTQTDAKGRLHPLGTPLGVLDIPQIGLREVIFEGTTGGVLMSGPGHRRDTPMPGQEGVTVLMGRQAAYGGPFKSLKDLVKGQVFTVTTGQGSNTFRVIGVRYAGDLVPPTVQAGKGRLILMTAAGSPWVPEGILRVDAELVSASQPAGPRPLTANMLPQNEKPLQSDTTVWIWVLLIAQAMFAASVCVTWARYRWGPWQAWMAGGPLLLALGIALTDQVAKLLPNLM